MAVLAPPENALVVRLPATRPFTDDDVLELQSLNPDVRLEQDAEGSLIIMAPAGGESSARNGEITWQLITWTRKDGSGEAFDSSAGFRLPRTNSLLSPDASWVRRDRWRQVPAEQRRKFAHLCPDFVVELRSPSDSLETLLAKMREYRANGARLGWLLDPQARTIHVFREGRDDAEVLRDPATVSGDPVLPGFTLDVHAVWRAGDIYRQR